MLPSSAHTQALTGRAAVCAADERVARRVLQLKGEGVLPRRILLQLLRVGVRQGSAASRLHGC